MSMKNRKPKTFKSAIATAVIVPTMFAGGFYASAAMVDAGWIPQIAINGTVDAEPLPVPEKDRKLQAAWEDAMDLVKQNNCWTEEDPAPEGVVPGHTVLIREVGDDFVAAYAGPQAAAKALDFVFAEPAVRVDMDVKFRVIAFCR